MVDQALGHTTLIGLELGHYRIVEKIGEGGMGEVYRARDEHLDREVAIKVLPPGTLADEHSRKRFRKEALALSKLNHPNVATIHDFDTQQGLDFLVMEYIPGITLSEKLAKGPLPEKEVIALGTQLAEGLSAAHEHGVVHRDLKPGNLRLTGDGRLKILDFGLAKLRFPVTASATTESLSGTETMAGTLPYMAPEQLLGEEVDARTDIHAVGAVLYEMATGLRPFAEVEGSFIGAILRRVPVPPTTLNPKLSPELERIIERCLEKEPDNRPQSARELAVDLRRLLAPSAIPASVRQRKASTTWEKAVFAAILSAVVLLLFGLALNLLGLRDHFWGASGERRIESLAVLPLANLSGDPEQEYFADGITEELITDLAQIKALRVISRTSVMRYKKTNLSLPEIGRELNVDAVLEGSVQRSGNRVRITAQLIQTSSDRNVWAETYERDLRDVLSLRDEVARAIARKIQIELSPQERDRLSRMQSVVPEAYVAYLKGKHFADRMDPEGLKKGIEFFEQAVQKDPNYAVAWAALAHADFLSRFQLELPPSDHFLPAVKKAIELDDSLAEAHVVLADVTFHQNWKWTEGQSEFRHATELDPGSIDARQHYALSLWQLGRFADAIQEMQRARQIDPLSPGVNLSYATLLYDAHRDEEAIEQFKKTIELEPAYASPYQALGLLFEDKGRKDEAVEAYLKFVNLGQHNRGRIEALERVLRTDGLRAYWKKTLELLQEDAKHEHVGPMTFASVYLHLGDKENAMKWLEQAYQQRSPRLTWLKSQRAWDSLRSDPRFQDLLRRMNFPQ